MDTFLICLAIFALIVFILKWGTANYAEYDKRGVYYEKPWPLAGNVPALFLRRKSLFKEVLDFYNRNRNRKFFGFIEFRELFYVIMDPEHIKKIGVKDFEHFVNHQFIFHSDESIMNNALFALRDQRWKQMRNTLSPIFTASKMRSMFTLMNESFAECLEYLKTKSVNGAGFDIEIKEVFYRLSNDIIASTAFGLKVNSFENERNDFYTIGLKIVFFQAERVIQLLMATIAPQIFKLFRMKIFEPKNVEYFSSMVVDAMKQRRAQNIVRPDMIQLLMEAKQESEINWTDEELVAQCFIFFFAFFENNSVLGCFACYELMNNPDVQQKLYEEVKSLHEELNGKSLSYDDVNRMKYMDQFISEILRLWSLAPFTERVCGKPYTLRDDDGSKVFDFKIGDHVLIPTIGLHRDKRYHPDPDKFDPERFSDENKANIQPFTYLPFGLGPRSCIANRYALMQAKAILYNLVLNYRFERSENSIKDLLNEMNGFQLYPKKGFWFHLVPRK